MTTKPPAETQDATDSTSTPHRNPAPHAVDNTDWLKTAAIILVSVDHIGYFFIEDAHWWNVFGRLAAPTFFFLMGYAKTRTVPLRWIWLGVTLTLLDSWNTDWTWVPLNILLSLALVRIARPYVEILVQHHGWTAFALLISALFTVLPIAEKTVDYGAEGWLWAFFGLFQRMYVDGRPATDGDFTAQGSAPPAHAMTEKAGLMRLLACIVAAIVYVWQEQREFSFPHIHFGVFILGVGLLSTSLCLFQRGPCHIQPPEAIAGALRFIGRHTLEIYAIQLACFELIVKLVPDLAP
jgi:TraX protein